MITWTEKGHGLIDALDAVGIQKVTKDNVVSIYPIEREAEAQAIIDSYDHLPDVKKSKIAELKVEGLSRIQIVFPAINDFDELDLIREQWLSIAPAARQATTDFQVMIDTAQAGKAARAEINALTTIAEVEAYDVVNTPSWP